MYTAMKYLRKNHYIINLNNLSINQICSNQKKSHLINDKLKNSIG